MPSINLDLDYFSHPKTLRLINALGAGGAEAPIRLWVYAAKYAPSTGILQAYNKEELGILVGLLVPQIDALVKFGFLEIEGENYKVLGFLEHQGHITAFKKRATLANKKRWENYYKDPSSIHQASLTAPPTIPTILTNKDINNSVTNKGNNSLDNINNINKKEEKLKDCFICGFGTKIKESEYVSHYRMHQEKQEKERFKGGNK